ncbi:hypothetical protein [Sulfuriroseicoccus oceanibius]|uniref:Uncharacterized protein n=1 Tax=Sulfuriroseicoccus oceanibius TaxID=2707525 RepID=A0A6B3LC41_9BACT|nr:hypothetical protein [Sulfuriroseicoccus oceanibius]QQL46220.1 hypothetical protein G3M56_006460 [Sulfuriroseicoccus oceanibius]
MNSNTPPPQGPPLYTPSPTDPARRDNENLKLLAIFHFIFAGLYLLAIPFLMLQFTLMNSITNIDPMQGGPDMNASPPPGIVTEMFDTLGWFYLAIGIIILGFVAIETICGLSLLKRKNRIFCLIVSGLNCLSIPVGTALGVCTIIMLTKESVIAQFEQADRQHASR